MRQWHPLFAHFLRLVLEGRYEVLTNFAIGDIPREVDVVVLRRSALRGPSFRHLWRWLTTWNIMEFKGPTVTPRDADPDLLVEVGLGVARRLNEERASDDMPPLARRQISWWFIARKLPGKLVGKWRRRLGRLAKVDAGLWRGALCGYVVYFVSSVDTPLDEESLPLHMLAAQRASEETTLARYVLRHPDVYPQYAPWMFALHTEAWHKEQVMAGKVINENLEIDWTPVVEEFGLDVLVRQIGLARVIEEVGLARVIEEVGLARVIEEVGLARVIEEVGIDELLDNLSPEQLAKIKKRLG